MTTRRQRGAALVVGLILLTLLMLLGLAGADTVQVERQLAQNQQFRENAASAASAGIEFAISTIVSSTDPDSVPTSGGRTLNNAARFVTTTRFTGYELTLPQAVGANLAGAHFEITSTGYSARRTVDRQLVNVLWVVNAPVVASEPALTTEPAPVPAPECGGVDVHCYQRGELARLSWQRAPVE